MENLFRVISMIFNEREKNILFYLFLGYYVYNNCILKINGIPEDPE
jgi:hypothetical protein